MTGTDSSSVNERLNVLVSLLQSVGIDGVDSDALLGQQKRQMNGKTKTNKKADAPTSNDAQILEIVKKLQEAQASSPEILEALKSPELLALASLAAQKQGLQAAAPAPSKPSGPSLDDVMDDDDNYPKIGPGYSDDISCISELSTPTVMTRQQVAEEERYHELKAGGHKSGVGLAGNRLPRASRTAPKTKNMVGQVRSLAARRAIPVIPPKASGGAAAQRRLNYQMAMSKLESDGFAKGAPDDIAPPVSPAKSANSKSKSVNSKDSKKLRKAPSRTTSGARSIGSGSGGGDSKRKPRSVKANGGDIDWGTADGDGWLAFGDPAANNSSSTELFLDSDGFFADNAFSNDGSTGAAPSSSRSRRKKSEKGGGRSIDGSTSSGSKKKSSRDREERKGGTRKEHRSRKDKDSERALSDDEREHSTRKSHRLKKSKDDTLYDDGLGTSRKTKSKKDKDKDRDKNKSRRKARRSTMQV